MSRALPGGHAFAATRKIYTNGFDADTLADPRPVIGQGDPVVWTYVITNNGTMPLTITLSDDRLGRVAGASCAPTQNNAVLPAGAVTTCPGERRGQQRDLSNDLSTTRRW